MNRPYPSFRELPLRPSDPPFSAWSLCRPNDELGALNHLTSSVVKDASMEVRFGERFSLNWPIHLPVTPGFGRMAHKLEHRIHCVPGALILDDTLECLNTQRSSQWDGFRHFAYQKERLFYNSTAPEEILSPESERLGIHRWSQAGGIAGRGILIDYASWAECSGPELDMSANPRITFDDLQVALKMQQQNSAESLEIRAGDIILIRSGYIKAYQNLSTEAERAHGSAFPMHCPGLHQDRRTLEWLWSNKIAAVGGDAEAWECFPTDESAGFTFHEVLLAGWGCPIAELLWLEDLAAACKTKQKWAFLFTSSPSNVKGGVASPANAMAML